MCRLLGHLEDAVTTHVCVPVQGGI
jgi:hypothetical protein